MKSRKQMKMHKVLDDARKLVTLFVPQPYAMKKRIESLIERGYMKRDENDQTLFIYCP